MKCLFHLYANLRPIRYGGYLTGEIRQESNTVKRRYCLQRNTIRRFVDAERRGKTKKNVGVQVKTNIARHTGGSIATIPGSLMTGPTYVAVERSIMPLPIRPKSLPLNGCVLFDLKLVTKLIESNHDTLATRSTERIYIFYQPTLHPG